MKKGAGCIKGAFHFPNLWAPLVILKSFPIHHHGGSSCILEATQGDEEVKARKHRDLLAILTRMYLTYISLIIIAGRS